MASTKHRALRWLAPVALVGVVGLAACGDDEADSTRTANAGVAAVGQLCPQEGLVGEHGEDLARFGVVVVPRL